MNRDKPMLINERNCCDQPTATNAVVLPEMPNVSERDLTEQALRESEGRSRVVVEAANDAIITIDEHDIIIYANPAVEKIFGYHPTQLCGRDLAILMPAQPLPGRWIAAGEYDEEKRVRR